MNPPVRWSHQVTARASFAGASETGMSSSGRNPPIGAGRKRCAAGIRSCFPSSPEAFTTTSSGSGNPRTELCDPRRCMVSRATRLFRLSLRDPTLWKCGSRPTTPPGPPILTISVSRSACVSVPIPWKCSIASLTPEKSPCPGRLGTIFISAFPPASAPGGNWNFPAANGPLRIFQLAKSSFANPPRFGIVFPTPIGSTVFMSSPTSTASASPMPRAVGRFPLRIPLHYRGVGIARQLGPSGPTRIFSALNLGVRFRMPPPTSSVFKTHLLGASSKSPAEFKPGGNKDLLFHWAKRSLFFLRLPAPGRSKREKREDGSRLARGWCGHGRRSAPRWRASHRESQHLASIGQVRPLVS